MNTTKIFIFSGPGGAGKTTLLNQVFCNKQIKDDFMKGVSVTTRTKRPQEKEAKDYFFVDEKEFLGLKGKGFFLESQKILDDYYGTPKLFYTLAKKKKRNLVLCIDVKGGMCLKKNLKEAEIITLFISAPTEKELFARMKKRSESKGMMKKRVKLAKEELKVSKRYNYLIVNKNIKSTAKKIEDILLANS